MKPLISPDEARHIVLTHSMPLSPVVLPHSDVLGFTLSQDVVANDDLPPFDNSSMDGYALQSTDTRNASPTSPETLQVVGTVAAGSAIEYSIEAGHCAKIMTGAPIPPGADAVLMREETNEEDVAHNCQVQILAPVKQGENIRRRGSDVHRGEVVIPRGTLVRAAQWGMLASLGYAQVEVFPHPRVGLLTTGDELVGVDATLQAGQIRDSNSWTLRALAQSCGARIEHRKVGDDAQELREAFLSMFETCDVVVSSGGVSAGDFDPVRDVVPTIADLHFWKIAMKPGKPVMFAMRREGAQAEGARKIPVFGLPGNPVSVMVAFEQFVRPCLLQMQGRSNWKRTLLRVRVLDGFRSADGRTEFARAVVRQDDSGEWTARVQSDQGSGRLSTMTNANGLLIVPAATTQVNAGDILTAEIIE
ncbi:MAG TPA: gephyrin-like molybdotransferase Glp [Abditibacteriaceae bacterium]|nr:gephyrin-like molybdotransferase Glp [Abditibacteriaceae bacterium]